MDNSKDEKLSTTGEPDVEKGEYLKTQKRISPIDSSCVYASTFVPNPESQLLLEKIAKLEKEYTKSLTDVTLKQRQLNQAEHYYNKYGRQTGREFKATENRFWNAEKRYKRCTANLNEAIHSFLLTTQQPFCNFTTK